jgi:hypothetical protein
MKKLLSNNDDSLKNKSSPEQTLKKFKGGKKISMDLFRLFFETELK